MSTVVLTLVLVGGSIAVAAKLAVSEEPQPATPRPKRHREPRARRRPARVRASAPADGIDLGAYDAGDVLVERVAPRPSLFVRLRALLVLAAVVATIGALVALAISTGITTLSRALESTVS